MENDRNIDSILMNINRSSAGIIGAITFSSRMTFKLVMFMLRLGHKGAVGLGLADDFKAFVKDTKGEFTVYNIPLTQEKTDTVLKIQSLQKQVDIASNPIKKAELRQEIKSLERMIPELEQIKGLGIKYCTMPKLNGSSQTFQIAVSKKHDQVFKTWFLNHLTSELRGGEKNLEDIKVFTEGNYSIFNMPFEGKEMEPMLSDFKTLGVNYSVMPDLKIGDGYTQVVIPNTDRSRLEAWFKLWQEQQLATGGEVKEMYEINSESYMNTAEMSQDEYITSADKQYQDINKEFEEKAISVPYSDQLQKENSPEYVKYLQDNNYEKISINKETLVENLTVSQKVNEMKKDGWFASRIPGTYGENQQTLLVPMGRVFEADDGKTYVAFIKKSMGGFIADSKGNVNRVAIADVMKPYEKVTRAFEKVKSMDATKTMDAAKTLSEGANKTVEMASKLTPNMKL